MALDVVYESMSNCSDCKYIIEKSNSISFCSLHENNVGNPGNYSCSKHETNETKSRSYISKISVTREEFEAKKDDFKYIFEQIENIESVTHIQDALKYSEFASILIDDGYDKETIPLPLEVREILSNSLDSYLGILREKLEGLFSL